ncbi:S8 family serine peptidase [Candidatus Woesearchaeota archaeon]|nr:S8 family serine peptidase [Candidatus Woesearchaeota archaeon]
MAKKGVLMKNQKKWQAASLVALLIILVSMIPLSLAAENQQTNRIEKLSKAQLSKLDEQVKERLNSSDATIKVLLKKKKAKKVFGISVLENANRKAVFNALSDSEGKVYRETKNYVVAEVPADKLADLVLSNSVEMMYAEQNYNLLLEQSVPAVNAPAAWNIGYTGAGVKVAVLDTGIDYGNSAFQNRVVLSQAFTGENHTIDLHGHGTHVAGIIGGNGTLKGVAPDALLLNAKVLNDYGSGTSSSIIAGIEWAVQNGARVISISFGKSDSSQDIPLFESLQYAIDNGAVVVAASGNCGSCGSCNGFFGVTTPGNFEPAITVGAVDDLKQIACFSSGQDFGSYVKPDVVAPGVNINSYYINSQLKALSGTSMSTPHVSGAVALLLQKNSSLNNSEAKKLLESSAVDLGAGGKDISYGSGFIDISKLVLGNAANQTLVVNNTNITNPIIQNTTNGLIVDFRKTIDVNDTNPISLSSEQYLANISLTIAKDGIPSVQEYSEMHYFEYNFTKSSEIGNYNMKFNLCGDNCTSLNYSFDVVDKNDGIQIVSIQPIKESDIAFIKSVSNTFSIDAANESGALEYSSAEASNTCTGAGLLNLNTLYYAYIQSAGDVDWFYFNVPGAGTGEFTTTLDVPTNRDYELELYDSCSNMICFSYGGTGTDEKCIANISSKSKMYAKVYGYNSQYDASSEYYIKSTFQEKTGYARLYVNNYEPSGYYLYIYIDGSLYGSISVSGYINYLVNPDIVLSSGSHSIRLIGTNNYNSKTYDKTITQTISGGAVTTFQYNIDLRDCTSGSCCDSYGYFKGTNWICNSIYQTSYGCPWGTDAGSDVGIRYQRMYCSGTSSSCNGNTVWGDWALYASCSSSQRCNSATLSCENIVVCGDGTCSSNEVCPKDCLKVTSFTAAVPSEVSEGQEINVEVNIKNIGTVTQSGKVEVGIIPTDFFNRNILQADTSWPVTGCCEQNEYYDTREVERDPGSQKYTVFTLKAPTTSSFDNCDANSPKKSAWGSSFKVIAGAYDACGGSYYSSIEKTISIKNRYDYIDLVDYSLVPPNPIVYKGNSLKFRYQISNSWHSSVNVGLGASLRDSNSKGYNDEPNDIVISVLPGTYWYERTFTTNNNYIFGNYDAAWGVHKVDANNKFAGEIEFSNPLWADDLVKVVGCGDGACGSGETSTSCPQDCYANIQIGRIEEISPASAVENQQVTFQASVSNTGTVQGEKSIEGAVVPESWAGIIYPATEYSTSYVEPITKPCPDNKYYDAFNITLNPNEGEFVQFTVIAPNRTSVDACNPSRSAWDPNGRFRVIAGTFQNAGDTYESFKNVSYTVNQYVCLVDSECPDGALITQYCLGNDIYEDYNAGKCSDNKCSFQPKSRLVKSCAYGCTSGTCNPPPCNFKDGSSMDCECDSDVECPSGHYCNQVSGPDACEKIIYQNQCSNFNDYFCEDGAVKKCVNNGKFWEKQKIDGCTGKFQYCDPSVVDGTGNCSEYPKNFDVWLDYADTGMVVNKQPGDKLKINVYSESSYTLNVIYDSSIFAGNCRTMSVHSGENTCSLTVLDTAEEQTIFIKVENKPKQVNIINKPELLIITDSEKLTQQFQFESNGVKAVLKQAYANARDKGVVYDLSWYKNELGTSSPFSSFVAYNEKITKPSMTDNSYSTAVSTFIKDKCTDCKDVMIVGDDYVVPGYRAETVNYDSDWYYLWLNKRIETSPIYTDSPYIIKKKTFGEINSLFVENGKKKNVALVYSNNADAEVINEISNLKNLIKTKYSIDSEIIDSSAVACNSFNKLKDKTLIIIGRKNSNNLLPCYSMFESDFNNSVSIERNLWSNKKDSSVIIDEKKRAILTFEEFIKDNQELVKFKEKSKVYAYANDFLDIFKNFEVTLDDGTKITIEQGFRGYIMGQCEYIPGLVNSLKCSAFDMTVSSIPGVGIVTDARDAALICPEFVAEGGTLNGIVCGASTGGAITSATTIIFGATVVGGVASEGADIALSTIKVVAKTIARVDKRIFEVFKFGNKIDSMKSFFKINDWKEVSKIKSILKNMLENARQIRVLIDTKIDVIGKHIKSFDNLVKTSKTYDKVSNFLKNNLRNSDSVKKALDEGKISPDDLEYFDEMLANKNLKVSNFGKGATEQGGVKYPVTLENFGKPHDEAYVFVRSNYPNPQKFSHQLQVKNGEKVYNFRLDSDPKPHSNIEIRKKEELDAIVNEHLDLDLDIKNQNDMDDALENFFTLIKSTVSRGELP